MENLKKSIGKLVLDVFKLKRIQVTPRLITTFQMTTDVGINKNRAM